MNRSNLRQRVKELLDMAVVDPAVESGTPSNSVINQSIKEARDMIYARLQTEFPRRFGASSTLSVAADAESTALPTAVKGFPIFKVTAKRTGETNDFTLDPSVIEEHRNYTRTGEPIVFAVVKETIYLRPIRTSALTLTLWHSPAVTDLTDTTSPDELVAHMHHIIAYGAAIRCSRALRDPVGHLVEQYDEDMKLMMMHYEQQQRDHHVHEIESAAYYGDGV